MSLEIKGKITAKLDVESGVSKNNKNWKRQSFVIDTGAEYNPTVCFSMFGHDKVKELEGFQVGEQVNVKFNVYSREFKGKYYHSLDAWKIESTGETVSRAPAQNVSSGEDVSDNGGQVEDDDLPF